MSTTGTRRRCSIWQTGWRGWIPRTSAGEVAREKKERSQEAEGCGGKSHKKLKSDKNYEITFINFQRNSKL